MKTANNELTEFCSVNNATPAFKGLPTADVLTIDLQRSLFVSEKRGVFKAKISDVWKSKKQGSMMVVFSVSVGDRDIDAYLKCTESQVQNLHDEYRRDKNTAFLVVCEFERVDAVVGVAESDSEEPYTAIGTLVLAQVAKETERE